MLIFAECIRFFVIFGVLTADKIMRVRMCFTRTHTTFIPMLICP